jgi:hypothetical protein
MRLMVLQGVKLPPDARAALEAAILAGPPRHKYRDDLEPEDWQSLVNHSIWLRLAKLREGSGQLGSAASHQFANLSAANPKWVLASDERDEFSHWMSGTGDKDFEASRDIDPAPRKRSVLVEWLKRAQPKRRPFYEDTWRDTCRTRFFHSFFALCDLAQSKFWPAGHPGTVIEMAHMTVARRRIFYAIRAAAIGWDGTDPIRRSWPS